MGYERAWQPEDGKAGLVSNAQVVPSKESTLQSREEAPNPRAAGGSVRSAPLWVSVRSFYMSFFGLAQIMVHGF